MIRFRDIENTTAVAAHNQILDANGRVLWGLWLKQVENANDIKLRLSNIGGSLEQIYIVDTTHKISPVMYVASVSRIITEVGDLIRT